MPKYYTGIGSRATPEYLKFKIAEIAKTLEESGYILRSGGAKGADTYFEESVVSDKNKEIYLPWKEFNNNTSNKYNITNNAYTFAAHFHPNWNKLSSAAKNLMARNCYQVMGEDLQSASKFVLCWTQDGTASGGTGQAIRIAQHFNIPVINMFHHKVFERQLYEVINHKA